MSRAARVTLAAFVSGFVVAALVVPSIHFAWSAWWHAGF